MERTLTPDERIRRAEEIYYRRKNQNLDRSSIRLREEEKPNYTMIKKMVLQIIICIVIYSIFYMIQNTNYIFSENVIGKTKEILSYDINIQNLYDKAKEYINSIVSKNQEKNNEESNKELQETENSETQEKINQTENENSNIEANTTTSETNNTENIGGEEVAKTDENLSEMEKDARSIIATKSLIVPLKGVITSRYGPRNPTDPKVPKYHTGIDIAVNTGTVFIASMEGIVEEVSSQGDYGNHVKITNGDVMTLYAHCSKIYVSQGDTIKQGQEIGETGATGNVTGPHLHFEIRKENRYVDPDLILKF